MKVKCIDDCNREEVITKNKEYVVKSSGLGKYVIINDLGELSCINKMRFAIIKE